MLQHQLVKHTFKCLRLIPFFFKVQGQDVNSNMNFRISPPPHWNKPFTKSSYQQGPQGLAQGIMLGQRFQVWVGARIARGSRCNFQGYFVK